MVDLNQERKAFEGKFPKPHWIEWDEELGQYTSKHVSDVGYQARFEVWLEAKAQAVPEWISVEDHLPEEGQEVIVHHFGHVVQATKDKNYVGGFKQRNCYGWECVSSYISHWQPKNFKLPDNYSMYYTDANPYKETLASKSGAEQ
ncbi:TPA: DUF551 domain-containing protein [Acinetobacter baumannii]